MAIVSEHDKLDLLLDTDPLELLRLAHLYRSALEAIEHHDDLLEANPEVFGLSAARRMQAVARAALDQL